ncbi:MAG TPA: Rrf2 family transcriptional regulator [Bryobacterales bacterium]|nr:Rrf2 family transcriptional regulator [Bryobacterales bacterium]
MSRSSLYAIRALTYLACQAPGKLSGTRDIARHEGIPAAFLGKVLQQLRRGRLLRAYRGTGGGYELALPPEKITLLAVLRCMDGASGLDSCVLEERDCSYNNPCALHNSWGPVQARLLEFFESNTLAELVAARQSEARRSALHRE